MSVFVDLGMNAAAVQSVGRSSAVCFYNLLCNQAFLYAAVHCLFFYITVCVSLVHFKLGYKKQFRTVYYSDFIHLLFKFNLVYHEMFRSPDFIHLDPLMAIAKLVEPEYQKKINKRIQSRLRAAHLRGCPQELSSCVDSADREYLPRGITTTLSSLDFVSSGMNLCILGPSDSGKSYLAKALGIVACNDYKVEYHHCEVLLEQLVALKAADYMKYQKRLKRICGVALLILDDFLLHTLSDEREVKILFEILEKRCEINLSTIICSQRDPSSWSAMIMNDEVSANAILKRATKHYTVMIKPKTTV